MPSYWECDPCHARLIMASADGRRVMLDWARSDNGAYAVQQTAAGAHLARLLGQGETPLPFEHRHDEHYATSPQCRPAAPEQRAAAAEVSDFLGDYRKALAANAKARRNRRGRRPAPPITGYRVNPPHP